jgi:hypothetical protein
MAFASIISAQEQLTLDKKVFMGQNGKLYINKDLGVYLWISASPDENSDKVRLFSDSTKKYSNPMYLDTEGYNTVRSPSAVDTSTKKMIQPEQDIIFEVYADGKPPVSHAGFIGNSQVIKNKKYYSDSVRVEIKATDAVSGIDKIYFSTSDDNFVEYKSPIVLSGEGDHSIRFYAIDNVGNREELKSVEVSIRKK